MLRRVHTKENIRRRIVRSNAEEGESGLEGACQGREEETESWGGSCE